MALLSEPLIEHLQDFLSVAYYMMVRLDVLVDLRPVNVDVDDLSLIREYMLKASEEAQNKAEEQS